MENLAAYFKRIKNILKDKSEEKKMIRAALREFGVDVSEGDISIDESGRVRVSGGSAQKNAIFLKKKEIMEYCQREGVSVIDLQ